MVEEMPAATPAPSRLIAERLLFTDEASVLSDRLGNAHGRQHA